jgi:anaerobic selenocysteine-containing dehydrogenase
MDADFDYPLDDQGEPQSEPIWNEIQQASRGFYNEFVDGDGNPITLAQIQDGEGVQWAGTRRYVPSDDGDGAIFPGILKTDLHRARFHVPIVERLTPFIRRDPAWFTLITGRGGLGGNTLKVNIAMFNSATAIGRRHWPDENMVCVSPEDAARLTLAAGDQVELVSPNGTLVARVQMAPGVPAGHLYMTFHPDRKGSSPNVLTHSDRFDPHTWQPLLKDTQVTMRKLAAQP